MTDSGTPIQSQTATFLAGGAKRGEGYLLLYPDNLTAVTGRVGTWGYRGTMEKWQGHLAHALTARGREVHTAVEGITVLSWAAPGEG